MENWKEVVGSNGEYLVSDCGRLKTAKTGRILKPTLEGGYERVKLFKMNREKSYRVHRLVAEAFISNPDNLPQVNHKDGNKRNNRVSNLEWCTAKENLEHAYKNGLRYGHQKYCESKKKKVIATSLDGKTTLKFNSVAEARRHFNTCHIADVLNGHREQTKGFRFMLDRSTEDG